MVTAGLPVRGPARLWSRSNAPTPHSLPTASSFLLLVNDFLSGPGSPEDGRVGVGYLIEGRCDCSRFKLEPWSLCSFLFCGFSEVHIGPSKGGPSLKRLPIGGLFAGHLGDSLPGLLRSHP